MSYHNKPYINGKLIHFGFRERINLSLKNTLMTGFVVHVHKLLFLLELFGLDSWWTD